MNAFDHLSQAKAILTKVRCQLNKKEWLEALDEAIKHVGASQEKLGDFDSLFPPHPEDPRPIEISKDEVLIKSMSSIPPEVRRWASGFDQLAGVGVEVISISWWLNKYLGMSPEGKASAWKEQTLDLYRAGGGDWETIKQGIQDARQSRMTGDITLKNPRSVSAYITNARQRKIADHSKHSKTIVVQE